MLDGIFFTVCGKVPNTWGITDNVIILPWKCVSSLWDASVMDFILFCSFYRKYTLAPVVEIDVTLFMNHSRICMEISISIIAGTQDQNKVLRHQYKLFIMCTCVIMDLGVLYCVPWSPNFQLTYIHIVKASLYYYTYAQKHKH